MIVLGAKVTTPYHSAGSLLQQCQLFMLKNELPAYVEFYGSNTMFTKAQ